MFLALIRILQREQPPHSEPLSNVGDDYRNSDTEDGTQKKQNEEILIMKYMPEKNPSARGNREVYHINVQGIIPHDADKFQNIEFLQNKRTVNQEGPSDQSDNQKQSRHLILNIIIRLTIS